MARDLSHLIPTAESLAESQRESLERSILGQLMRGMGAPAQSIREMGRQDEPLPWFYAEYPTFPFRLRFTRSGMSVQDFFERPTKTKACIEFLEQFAGEFRSRPCALLFRSPGFTTLALFSSPTLAASTDKVLRFNVRQDSLFVTTLQEFSDAYVARTGGGLAT